MRYRAAIVIGLLAFGACTRRTADPPRSTPIQFQRVSADPVAHGRRLADVLGCRDCHGNDLTGKDWSDPELGILWTANLSRAIPAYSDAQLVRVIQSGTRPDRELWGMPSHLFTQLAPEDMASLIAFLRTIPPAGQVHPLPTFPPKARQEIAAGRYRSSRAEVQRQGRKRPPDVGPGDAFGRYIVRATCAECHGIDLRGGQPDPVSKYRPDLRIVAAYDLAEFRHLLRTGIAKGGRNVSLMSAVAKGRFSHFTDAEVEAVYRYLQRVAQIAP